MESVFRNVFKSANILINATACSHHVDSIASIAKGLNRPMHSLQGNALYIHNYVCNIRNDNLSTEALRTTVTIHLRSLGKQ